MMGEILERVWITKHANKRMKERIPRMKSRKRRMDTAQRAYLQGIRFTNATGSQRARILRYQGEHPIKDIVLYIGMAFIFDGGNLITVLYDEGLPVRNKGYNRAKERRDTYKESYAA